MQSDFWTSVVAILGDAKKVKNVLRGVCPLQNRGTLEQNRANPSPVRLSAVPSFFIFWNKSEQLDLSLEQTVIEDILNDADSSHACVSR